MRFLLGQDPPSPAQLQVGGPGYSSGRAQGMLQTQSSIITCMRTYRILCIASWLCNHGSEPMQAVMEGGARVMLPTLANAALHEAEGALAKGIRWVWPQSEGHEVYPSRWLSSSPH
jgi:hypothetical protein